MILDIGRARMAPWGQKTFARIQGGWLPMLPFLRADILLQRHSAVTPATNKLKINSFLKIFQLGMWPVAVLRLLGAGGILCAFWLVVRFAPIAKAKQCSRMPSNKKPRHSAGFRTSGDEDF